MLRKLGRLRACATALVLATAGCQSVSRLELEPRWRPLRWVSEDPYGATPSGMCITRFDTVYVKSLPEFVRDYPPGSLSREGILSHEVVHSERETYLWLVRYAVSPSFRWAEERRAYAAEMTCYYDRGVLAFPVEQYARFCAGEGYDGLFGLAMVSESEALAWFQTTWEALVLGERPVD